MKEVISDYGMIAVAVVVILLFLAAATGIGQSVLDAVTSTISKFLEKSGVNKA